jgi:glucose-6-phosphate-specific signal transduction histidine kinase
VGKHARANTVAVRVGSIGLELVLEVVDDGNGFDPNAVAGSTAGMGIRNMRERAKQAGAVFSLQSQPNGGTQLRVSVPLRTVNPIEHRRQALIHAGCLMVAFVAMTTLRAPEMIAVCSIPLVFTLGYHLRVLWIAYKRGVSAA